MGNNDWDYAVFTITGMNPDWITNKEMFPPVNTVHVEEVNGKPICIVLERADRNDLEGYRAMRAGKPDSAKMYFYRALAYNPYNEQALENLADLYLNENRADSAFAIASFWASNVPSNVTALSLLANACFARNDISGAAAVASNIKKVAPNEITGYWLSAHCYLRQQNMQMALNELLALVEIQPYGPAYRLLAQIYQAAGQTQAAQQCMRIAEQLR